jgi:hypothetical protein
MTSAICIVNGTRLQNPPPNSATSFLGPSPSARPAPKTTTTAASVGAYLCHFRREQILIVRSEDLREARALTLGQVLDFLGVDRSRMPEPLAQEFYRTSDKLVPRPAARTLQRNPFSRALGRRIPWRSSRFAQRIALREIPSEIGDIPWALRDELAELLRDDVRRLRSLMGS